MRTRPGERMRRAVPWRGLAMLLALTPAILLADDVYLRGGGRITGQIVERTGESVSVDIGAGRMTVGLATVERIEEGQSPLGEYRERASELAAGDVDGWRELGRWAARHSLATQSRAAFGQVLTAVPDDPEANQAFGRVFFEGRWVSEEESYRAQGFVEFEGEWMTPAVRQQILDGRGAQEAADREALEQQIREQEEARTARETEEVERQEAFWAGSEIPPGGVVHWSWGMGPTVWPSSGLPPSEMEVGPLGSPQ